MQVRDSLAALSRLTEEDCIDSTARGTEVSQLSVALATQLTTAWSSFKSTDVLHIVGSFAKLLHRHPPLMEAAATHVLRGMFAYPLFALCNVVNSFARLDYHHRQLMESVAMHLAEPSRTEQLSPMDIACLVFAYAQLGHRSGALLEQCAHELRRQHLEVSGPNAAIILNSYARLGECNPDLFAAMARSIVQTKPESFEVHNVSLIMNAFAKCSIRKPQLMQLLADFLDGRIHLLSPQNVANIIHACAKLECYDYRLFAALQGRLLTENLSAYKLYELVNVSHGLAKLKSGGAKIYEALFSECERRPAGGWPPRSVAQMLDAMRRQRAHSREALALQLVQRFFQDMENYQVHPLTQAAWCMVELDALELTNEFPSELLPVQAGESTTVCAMRLVLSRMEELARSQPLTATQRCYVQQLVRAYHYKHEVDYGLQPHHVRLFCRSLFDVPTSVASSVARTRMSGRQRSNRWD